MAKAEWPKIQELSFCSLFLEIHFGESIIARGTGFVWEAEPGDLLLVTTCHNLTGKHADTGDLLDEHGSVPDCLWVLLHRREPPGPPSAGYRVNLYDKQGRPRWFIHPEYKTTCDVAAVSIDPPEDFKCFPLNRVAFDDFRLEAGQDVFIVGFPLSIDFKPGRLLPIWKRGSIATEPAVDLDDLPKLLVDTATRPGMSGSPALARFTGYYQQNPVERSSEDWIGQGTSLLGVYSGRLMGETELEAQLGVVWKVRAIEEIIQGRLRPSDV